MNRPDPNLFPLRKIVGHTDVGGDVLECGHRLPKASDMYGPIEDRKKRRCGYCWKALSDSEKQKKIEQRDANKRKKQLKRMADWREYVKSLNQEKP